MKRITEILMICLLACASCEKVVTVEKTVVETETVDTPSPVPSLPSWGTSPVRIGLIGDSISTFGGWIPEGYTAYYPNSSSDIKEVEQTYWHRVIYSLMPDAVLDRNLAYSATRLTKLGIDDDKDRNDFITRVEEVGFIDPDIVIIHGGTNDRRTSKPTHVPLGEYDYDKPLDQLDRYSFRPSYICLVRRIMQNHPGVKIVCVIGDTLNAEKYKDLATSIKEIAGHYGCPVVDFVNPIESADGVHPNASGAEYMADRIFEVMEQENLLYYRR